MIEVIMAMALLGVLSMFFASMMTASQKMSAQMATNNVVESVRYSLSELLRHPTAVGHTIRASRNAAAQVFWCFRTPPSEDIPNPPKSDDPTDPRMIQCNDQTGNTGDIYVRRPDDTAFYDFDGATRGFTMAGQQCNAFDGVNGNDLCPIRYNMSVDIMNCGGNCECGDMSMRFRATLQYRPASEVRRFAYSGAGNRDLDVIFPMRGLCRSGANPY